MYEVLKIFSSETSDQNWKKMAEMVTRCHSTKIGKKKLDPLKHMAAGGMAN